ncbi:MAG TPA: acetyl-CoA carboxylase biotin carboxyl carrier protein subunit [Brumimicrobium sp.]|nr:acetyl-CoA carboxylase biotin carboxyl carrier protein subunit [Brumimicrobium sp.]
MGEYKYVVDGQEVKGEKGMSSIEWIDNTYFTIHFMGKQFHGEVLEDATEDQKLIVKINHRTLEIKRERPIDDIIRQLGLDKKKVKKLHQLKSPMPGRILRFDVNIGDTVQEGTPLLTLEAMKMENVIKAEGEGVVKAIVKSTEAVVDKGELIIEFE